MSRIVGTRHFFLDEAEEQLDSRAIPPRELREQQGRIEANRQHWSGLAKQDYDSTAEHFADQVDFAERMTPEAREVLADEVLEPLRRGEITPRAAAKRVEEMRADLTKAREALRNAIDREETKWQACSVSAAEYQRALHRRANNLFRGGRGLVELPIYDD